MKNPYSSLHTLSMRLFFHWRSSWTLGTAQAASASSTVWASVWRRRRSPWWICQSCRTKSTARCLCQSPPRLRWIPCLWVLLCFIAWQISHAFECPGRTWECAKCLWIETKCAQTFPDLTLKPLTARYLKAKTSHGRYRPLHHQLVSRLSCVFLGRKLSILV